MVILGTEFGSILTTPRPDEKDLILKFVTCEIRKFPYENLFFLLGKLGQKIVFFHPLINGETRYRVWFDLDSSLTR